MDDLIQAAQELVDYIHDHAPFGSHNDQLREQAYSLEKAIEAATNERESD